MGRGTGGHTLSPLILRARTPQAEGSEKVIARPRSHSGPVQGLEPGPRRTCQGRAGKTDPRPQPARAILTRETPARPRLGTGCRTLRPTPSPRAPFLTSSRAPFLASPASAAAAARLANPPQAQPRPRRRGPAPNIFSREFAGGAAETVGAPSQCACALRTPPPLFRAMWRGIYRQRSAPPTDERELHPLPSSQSSALILPRRGRDPDGSTA